jgi:hypothetical protein
VAVDVDVIAGVIVAALGNGNDAVDVIDAVDAQGSINFSIATNWSMLERDRLLPSAGCILVHGIDHVHGVVPVPERGHDHAGDHVHVHVHVHGVRLASLH